MPPWKFKIKWVNPKLWKILNDKHSASSQFWFDSLYLTTPQRISLKITTRFPYYNVQLGKKINNSTSQYVYFKIVSKCARHWSESILVLHVYISDEVDIKYFNTQDWIKMDYDWSYLVLVVAENRVTGLSDSISNMATNERHQQVQNGMGTNGQFYTFTPSNWKSQSGVIDGSTSPPRPTRPGRRKKPKNNSRYL